MSYSSKDRRDPDVRLLRGLAREARDREEQGLCLLEGIKCVKDYLRSGGSFHLALSSPRLTRNPAGVELEQELRHAADQAGVPFRELSEDALEFAGNANTGQGILLAVPLPPALELARATGPILVAWEVQDPANIGGLARVASGAGFAGLVVASSLGGGSADPFSPRAVRASAASCLRLPIHFFKGEAAELCAELGEKGFDRVACTARGGVPPDQLELAGAVALLLGSEAHGLPVALSEGARQVTLPLHGELESLNVMAAAAIVAFEVERQRRVS